MNSISDQVKEKVSKGKKLMGRRDDWIWGWGGLKSRKWSNKQRDRVGRVVWILGETKRWGEVRYLNINRQELQTEGWFWISGSLSTPC